MAKSWKNYPKQVRSILRKSKTLGVDAELFTPREEVDRDNSPLEMHSGYSRFVFTLIDKVNAGGVVINKANIPASEITFIKEKTKLAMEQMISLKNKTEKGTNSGPAYNQKLFINSFKGKTAAEILSANPANQAELLRGRAWLESNLAKYPNNKKQMDAIDQAIQLLKAGKLDNTVTSVDPIEIYSVDFKPFSEKDSEGRRRVYGISIYCDPSKNYPFYININNCFAPVGRMPNGTINVQMASAVKKTRSAIGMTELEWYSLIDRVSATLKNFEQMNFEKQFEIAKKHSYKYD